MDKSYNKYDFNKSKYCSEVFAGYGFKDTMPSQVYDFFGKMKFLKKSLERLSLLSII